jgi:hypothetical protein
MNIKENIIFNDIDYKSVIDKVKTDLNAFLNNLGIKRIQDFGTSKILSGYYSSYECSNNTSLTDEELKIEINLALEEELYTEIRLLHIFQVLKDVPPQIISEYKIDWSNTQLCCQDHYTNYDNTLNKGIEESKRLFNATWAIISLYALTIIQHNRPLEILDRNNLWFRYKDIQFYIDQYASSDATLIFGNSKSFVLKGKVLSVENNRFFSDYEIIVDKDNLSQANIEIYGILK